MQNDDRQARIERLGSAFFAVCLLLFVLLGAYQLRLPGLHYDEAKEAGLNAMELVTGRPVTAFRDATIQVGPWRLPLMVQDYIGALNVALAAPLLKLGGVNVLALRCLSLLEGALTLLLTWRVARRLGGPIAAAATAALLAVNATFIFWSRQGIFVTNLTALIFMASLLTGLRWWDERRPRDLWLTAFLWGLGLYAKLLFVWAIGAMIGVAALAWLLAARSSKRQTESQKPVAGNRITLASHNRQPPRRISALTLALTLALASIFFLIPLVPLILFNLRTAGTLDSVSGNLGQSYYGVNNAAYLPNLLTRLGQLITLLRGDHLGYLGGPFADAWAPWLSLGLILLAGLALGVKAWRVDSGKLVNAVSSSAPASGSDTPAPLLFRVLVPLLLLVPMIALSAFTVSDLFITHYALLVPLIPLAGGLACGALVELGGEAARGHRGAFLLRLLRALALIALLAWAGGELLTDIRYHRALTASGGHGQHSDAIYELAERLDSSGLITPVALDWGMDAQLRYLTAGRVQPTEVFGYASLAAPDPGFAERVSKLLDDPNNIYLAHVPEHTVFRERVNALAELAAQRGLTLREQAYFPERDGTPLIIVYRAGK